MSERWRRKELAYRGMRVGLFGGSFNPAHEGHAHVAETARRRLGLHRVWWLVTPQNPLKDPAQTTPLRLRLANARRFARGAAMVVSDLEDRMHVGFSVDTIRMLKRKYPGVRFVWVMGSDNLAAFHRWRRWVTVMNALPAVFVARPGFLARARFAKVAQRFRAARAPESEARALAEHAPPAWMTLSGPLVRQSSTALRAKR